MSTLRNSPTEPTTTARPPERRFIRTCTYNIIHAGANNLNMALRAMHQMRVDFGFLTETKLSHDKYTHEYQGYKVYATTSSPNQGGVALFFRNSNQWTIEGVRSFGPNIIRCSLVSGSHRWTIFGIYIPPSDSTGETLHWLEQASVHSTRHPVILLGDLNVDLDHIRDDRGHDIADALALLGVSDVSAHFTHPRGRWTWSQARQDRYIRSVTDYILSSSPKDFSRWAIKYPRYCSDHRAIVLPKSEHGKYRGISLLEVLYKLCGMIIHIRLKNSITFHNDIHGFVCHRGTGTAILECKLEMQRAKILKIPYFQIFLDLSKAYDSLDRDRLLQILRGYGVGPNTLRFLERNWSIAMLVPRIGGYYGPSIDSDRGIWQGDILSPDFFDIAVDAVFREWHRIADDITTGSTTTGKSYADDIRLGDTDQHRLQRNLDILLELFARLGLMPNAIKTKAMVSIGKSSGRMSDSAYKRRFDRSLPTYRARKRSTSIGTRKRT